MRSGIIARKLGMTRIYTEEGAAVPVTVLKIDSVHVVGHKTLDKHGYTAVQLGSGTPKVKNLTKADLAFSPRPMLSLSASFRNSVYHQK